MALVIPIVPLLTMLEKLKLEQGLEQVVETSCERLEDKAEILGVKEGLEKNHAVALPLWVGLPDRFQNLV